MHCSLSSSSHPSIQLNEADIRVNDKPILDALEEFTHHN
uniref:Uncharacterized protein n=1 Tax=Anguilla anguilla TaxID=7936 RepID=A0A0E9R4T1_ANGAN